MVNKDWWVDDRYDVDVAIPEQFQKFRGPAGIAAVQVFKSGKTAPGWGLVGKKLDNGTRGPNFTELYPKRLLDARTASWRFNKQHEPFALVMRSMRVVALDIDGKNGGLDGALTLGDLPPTLAETSKSGNGYHLFFFTEEQWSTDPATYGYALYDDHIGIAQGVDFRGTGCVFHYPSQRWNNRQIAALPDELVHLLDKKKSQRTTATPINPKEMDEVDMLVAHHTLLEDLAKDIPVGKRNTTLFAIGSKMKAAGVPDWEDKVHARALAVGLGNSEADKLVNNIATYGE